MKREWKHKSVRILLAENKGISDDPIEIIKEKCRGLVLDAFSMGWTGPPFDPIQLAKLKGIEIIPNEIVADARVIPISGGHFKIEYNPMQNHARINFSLAHEIGHTLFPDCGELVRNREKSIEQNSWELEFLCNVAASEILLPYAEFTIEAGNVNLDLNSLISISKKYRASMESVLLRFSEVANRPCAIAIASFKRDGKLSVDYSRSSTFSFIEIKQGYIIPDYSSPYECTQSGWTTERIEDWEIFEGIPHRVFSIGLTPVKKQTEPRIGLFLVPEKYSLAPPRSIRTIFQDATEPIGEGVKIIAQLVNTFGGTGAGFGKTISKKFPSTRKELLRWKSDPKRFKLGNVNLVELRKDLFVAQLLAQSGIKAKYGETSLSYEGLRSCLFKLRDISNELNASIHMPAIGSGQAGGNWDIIRGMIYDVLVKSGRDVTIYLLPGSNTFLSQSHVLTLFDEDSLYEK